MLIESYKDIEYMLSWNIEKSNISIQKKLFVELSDEEEIIKKILEKEGKQAIDIISLKSIISITKYGICWNYKKFTRQNLLTFLNYSKVFDIFNEAYTFLLKVVI